MKDCTRVIRIEPANLILLMKRDAPEPSFEAHVANFSGVNYLAMVVYSDYYKSACPENIAGLTGMTEW
jgi:hypothetical protein